MGVILLPEFSITVQKKHNFSFGSSVCLSHIVGMDITSNQIRKIIKTDIFAHLFQTGLESLFWLEVVVIAHPLSWGFE